MVFWGVRGKIKSALNVRSRRKEKIHSCILHNNCNDRNIHARIINTEILSLLRLSQSKKSNAIKSQISTSEILYFVYEYLSIKINRKGNTELNFLGQGMGKVID